MLLLVLCISCLNHRSLAQVELEAFEAIPIQENALPPAEVHVLMSHVRVVVGLARRVCKPNEEQIAEFKTVDEKWVQEEYIAFRDARPKGGLGAIGFPLNLVLPGRKGVKQPTKPAIIEHVKKSIEKQILGVLDEDQRPALQSELDERQKFRREAQAEIFLIILSRHIELREEQKEPVKQLFLKHLATPFYWSFYFSNTEYLPQLDAYQLESVLDDKQMATLNARHQMTLDSFQAMMLGGNQPIEFEE